MYRETLILFSVAIFDLHAKLFYMIIFIGYGKTIYYCLLCIMRQSILLCLREESTIQLAL